MAPITTFAELLRTMQPVLNPGTYAFGVVPEVNSDLAAVGLTAAVSRALADVGISCNVGAAAHHDHPFVPVERGSDAIDVVRRLQLSS